MALQGLTVSNGTLQLNGSRFRNIGVNWPGAIQRIYYQPNNGILYTPSGEQDDGIAYLVACKVKVIRVLAFPYWPAQWTYGVQNGKAWNVADANDREIYYLKIDAFLAKCRAAGIGVILSLFFRHFTVSDLVGGTGRDWLGSSNTRTYATTIMTEVVTRYLTEAAVYGYELSNEVNAHTNYAGSSWPAINTDLGSLASYPYASHVFNGDEWAGVVSWAYGVVRAIDNQRMFMSGNDSCRFFDASGVYGVPYPMQQFATQQQTDNPTNCASFHWYGNRKYGSPGMRGLESVLTISKHYCKQVGAAFVVGEWGNEQNEFESITWSGGVATLTINSSKSALAAEVGDTIYVAGTSTAWDAHVYTIASMDSTRKVITASCPQYASNFSGTGYVIDAGKRFARMLDAFYYSDTDVALLWMYDTDTYAPTLMSMTSTGLEFQQSMMLAMNTKLGW